MKSIKLSCGLIVEVDDVNIAGFTDFWLAVDADGELYAFTKEPIPVQSTGIFANRTAFTESLGYVSLGDVDWKSTAQFVACLDDIVVTPEPEDKEDKENEVTCLIATEVKVRCPHCQEINDGFYGDPRGDDAEFICEWCEKTYTIHKEADIEMVG